MSEYLNVTNALIVGIVVVAFIIWRNHADKTKGGSSGSGGGNPRNNDEN